MTDIDTRARKLLDHEDRTNERRAEREQAQESRLAEARKRIKAHDAEIVAEQARKEAQAKADEIARARHALAEEIERTAEELNRKLDDYAALHARHVDALRRAGRPLGHGHGLSQVIPSWWRSRFGGFGSLTETPSPFTEDDRTLAQRDALARTREAS